MRSTTPACARPKSARSPRKRPRSASSAKSSERAEREAAETRKRDEEDRRKHDEETKRKADEVAREALGEGETAGAADRAVRRSRPRKRKRRGSAAAPAAPFAPHRRRSGRPRRQDRDRAAARPPDPGHRAVGGRSPRALGGVIPPPRARRTKEATGEPKEKLVREVTIPEAITIQELANRMAERSVDVIKLLMKQGQMATINDVIDADTAQLIAEELGHTVKRVAEADVEEGVFDVADDPAALSRARRS